MGEKMYVKAGDRATYSRTISEGDVYLFGGVTGDLSKTHTNEAYMRERSQYGKRIAHGTLVGAPHNSPFTKLARRPKNRPSGTVQAT